MINICKFWIKINFHEILKFIFGNKLKTKNNFQFLVEKIQNTKNVKNIKNETIIEKFADNLV